jgi:hypothetical protein
VDCFQGSKVGCVIRCRPLKTGACHAFTTHAPASSHNNSNATAPPFNNLHITVPFASSSPSSTGPQTTHTAHADTRQQTVRRLPQPQISHRAQARLLFLPSCLRSQPYYFNPLSSIHCPFPSSRCSSTPTTTTQDPPVIPREAPKWLKSAESSSLSVTAPVERPVCSCKCPRGFHHRPSDQCRHKLATNECVRSVFSKGTFPEVSTRIRSSPVSSALLSVS